MKEVNTDTPDKFKFFAPVELSKGGKEDGPFVFEGLASDGSRDSDNETMEDALFQIIDRPVVNWEHKNTPGSYLGVLTDWTAKRGYLYVKGELYPEIAQAKDTITLMKTLDKYGKKNLGLSIEGQILERDIVDKKRIKKARVTAVALCMMPKNPATYTKICKAFSDGETIYQDRDELEYEILEKSDTLVNFTSPEGSFEIKRDGEMIFKSLKQEDNNIQEFCGHFITLTKAWENGQLDAEGKERFKEFIENLNI